MTEQRDKEAAAPAQPIRAFLRRAGWKFLTFLGVVPHWLSVARHDKLPLP